MRTFPNREIDKNKIVSTEIFGNRFHNDQSLYEYLIEFLLVFSSAKRIVNGNKVGDMRFHESEEEYEYYAETMMGLRRLIFFDSAKRDKSIPYDEKAYTLLVDELKKRMELDSQEKDKVIDAIQDLLRGYAVVLKKRTWCAQQVLPICPELVFCEAMPNYQTRLEKVSSEYDSKIDTMFEFAQRNFLARGGEIYYLHLLEALEKDDDPTRRNELNTLLNSLLTDQSKSISNICRFIQDTWYELIDVSASNKKDMFQKYPLGYIPADYYSECGDKAINELICYLSSDFQHIKKIDVLAKGIMFQIMRMMYHAVCTRLNIRKKPWIVDMTNNASKITKQLSSQSLREVEDDFKHCINYVAHEMEYEDAELLKRLKEAQRESLEIFRAKGKEMRCIIPISGQYERFTLSEDVLRFLVLSLVAPEEKITYEMFLQRLYENYGIVVGAKQYEIANENILNDDKLTIRNNLYENQKCFQEFLKSTGFLRELSDSTSLVFNPYKSIHKGE